MATTGLASGRCQLSALGWLRSTEVGRPQIAASTLSTIPELRFDISRTIGDTSSVLPVRYRQSRRGPRGRTIKRHILITGASRGIGAGLARYYAAPDVQLTLLARSEEHLAAVAESCRRDGAIVRYHPVDVGDASTVAAIVTDTSHGPVTLLIANAGIGGSAAVAGPGGEHASDARAIGQVNFQGVINTVAPALAGFAERRSGQIAIIGSLAGVVPLPSSPAYSAAKAGVRAYAIALDRLMRKSGVRVTHIAPGFVATDMSASLAMDLPYLVPLDDAVRLIARAIDERRQEFIFPWQLRLAAGVLSRLPDWLLVKILDQSQKNLER